MAREKTLAGGPKYQQRREEILQAATAIFDRKGYANTSLDDIAREVGIKREGLYYYFRNKPEILLDIIRPQSLALVDGLRAILVSDRGPEDRLRAAMANHLERFDQFCLEMTVSLRDAWFEEDAEVREEMNRIWKDYERMWTQLIAQGQAVGAFRAIGDPKMLAFGILGMCNWLARWYKPDGPVTVADLVESYAALVVHGLALPKLP